MSDEEWAAFFELMGKIIDLPITETECSQLIQAKAEEYEANLVRFCGYGVDA